MLLMTQQDLGEKCQRMLQYTLIIGCVCALGHTDHLGMRGQKTKNEFQCNTQVLELKNVGEKRDRKASKVKTWGVVYILR